MGETRPFACIGFAHRVQPMLVAGFGEIFDIRTMAGQKWRYYRVPFAVQQIADVAHRIRRIFKPVHEQKTDRSFALQTKRFGPAHNLDGRWWFLKIAWVHLFGQAIMPDEKQNCEQYQQPEHVGIATGFGAAA